MNKQKGFVQFIILGVVVLVIVGAGAFYLGKQVAVPKTQPQITQATPAPTPDETANWKTYTNEKYGFSVKYPLAWSYTELESTNPGLITDKGIMYKGLNETDITFFESTRPGIPEGAVYITGGLVRLRITRDQSLNNVGVEEFSGFYPSPGWEDVNVGVGIKGRAARHTHCQSADCYSILFKQGSTLFDFNTEAELGGQNYSEEARQKYLELMLATFKFTN